jgi:hypothetical protein
MTVQEMDTRLSQLLGDPNSRRWTQSDHRLPALNIAQNQLVVGILGFSATNKSIFDLLLGIQASKTVSIGATGFHLNGLHPDPGRMFTEIGFMRAKVVLDGIDQRCVRYSPDKESLSQNYYLKGNNEYPVIRFEANTVFVDVNYGYYPVNTTVHYIREPKELVVTANIGSYNIGVCELNTGLHELVIQMAEAECRRMGDDFEQYQLLRQHNQEQLQLMIQGSVGSVKSGTVGQFMRKDSGNA